jgi:carbon monoxide dehydrogenase subunit G
MKPMLATYKSSAPPERVWAVASDFAHAGGRIKAIQKVEILTPGPIGAGTIIRETRGAPGRRGTTIDMTLAAWNPPRSYSLRGIGAGVEFTSEIRCVPDGASGTRLEMEVIGRPLNFASKVFSPLLSLMSRMMVKQCARDLADIAAAAERAGDVAGEVRVSS